MRVPVTVRVIVAAAAAVLLSAPAPGVLAAEIRVLCSNGLRAALEELAPRFERTSGHTLAIEFSSAATLRQRIEGGERFDVALLAADVMDGLVASGKVLGATRVQLARAGIGVGLRSGASKPDVRTAASVKQAMLDARSIAYTRDGASRPHIDRMFERLGIADALGPRIRLLAAGQAPESVARGEADLVLTLISEILPVKGLELAGPLPAEFQSFVSFAAATGTKAASRDAVSAFVTFLDSPAAAETYRAKGMEPW